MIIITENTIDIFKIVTVQTDNDSYEFYKSSDNNYFMTREQIKKSLKYNSTKAICNIHSRYKKQLDKYSYFITLYCTEGNRYVKRKKLIYTIEGILFILQHSQVSQNKRNKLTQTIRNLTNKDFYIIDERKELSFISDLEDFLSIYYIKGISQFQVDGKYKIDYYIPDLHIAIEYDENNHKYYDKQKENERENYIKDKLNCQIFRVSNFDNNVKNLGKLVKDFVATGVLKRMYEYSLETDVIT